MEQESDPVAVPAFVLARATWPKALTLQLDWGFSSHAVM